TGASPGARPCTVPKRSMLASYPMPASCARSHIRASRSAGVSAGRCTPVPSRPKLRSVSSVESRRSALIWVMPNAASDLNGAAADFDERPDLRLDRAGLDALRGPEVLDRNADRFVIGDLVRAFTPWAPAGDHLGDLRHVGLAQGAFAERNLQVAGVREAVGAA